MNARIENAVLWLLTSHARWEVFVGKLSALQLDITPAIDFDFCETALDLLGCPDGDDRDRITEWLCENAGLPADQRLAWLKAELAAIRGKESPHVLPMAYSEGGYIYRVSRR